MKLWSASRLDAERGLLRRRQLHVPRPVQRQDSVPRVVLTLHATWVLSNHVGQFFQDLFRSVSHIHMFTYVFHILYIQKITYVAVVLYYELSMATLTMVIWHIICSASNGNGRITTQQQTIIIGNANKIPLSTNQEFFITGSNQWSGALVRDCPPSQLYFQTLCAKCLRVSCELLAGSAFFIDNLQNDPLQGIIFSNFPNCGQLIWSIRNLQPISVFSRGLFAETLVRDMIVQSNNHRRGHFSAYTTSSSEARY